MKTFITLTFDCTAWYYMLYKYQHKYHPEGKPHGRDIFLPGLNAHGVAGWKDIRLPKAAGNADNDVIEAGTL